MADAPEESQEGEETPLPPLKIEFQGFETGDAEGLQRPRIEANLGTSSSDDIGSSSAISSKAPFNWDCGRRISDSDDSDENPEDKVNFIHYPELTSSSCDLSYPARHPQQAHDSSDRKNEGEESMPPKYQDAWRVLRNERRQKRSSRQIRRTKSESECTNLQFYTDASETSIHSACLTRSASDNLDTSDKFESDQRGSTRMPFHLISNSKNKWPSIILKHTPSEVKDAECEVEDGAENPETSSDDAGKYSSEESRRSSLQERGSSGSLDKSCDKSEFASVDARPYCEIDTGKEVFPTENVEDDDARDVDESGKILKSDSKSTGRSTADSDSSSLLELSEVSWSNTDEVQTYSRSSCESLPPDSPRKTTSSADCLTSDCLTQESPPQITSKPPNKHIIKVPAKRKGFKTPDLASSFAGPSENIVSDCSSTEMDVGTSSQENKSSEGGSSSESSEISSYTSGETAKTVERHALDRTSCVSKNPARCKSKSPGNKICLDMCKSMKIPSPLSPLSSDEIEPNLEKTVSSSTDSSKQELPSQIPTPTIEVSTKILKIKTPEPSGSTKSDLSPKNLKTVGETHTAKSKSPHGSKFREGSSSSESSEISSYTSQETAKTTERDSLDRITCTSDDSNSPSKNYCLDICKAMAVPTLISPLSSDENESSSSLEKTVSSSTDYTKQDASPPTSETTGNIKVSTKIQRFKTPEHMSILQEPSGSTELDRSSEMHAEKSKSPQENKSREGSSSSESSEISSYTSRKTAITERDTLDRISPPAGNSNSPAKNVCLGEGKSMEVKPLVSRLSCHEILESSSSFEKTSSSTDFIKQESPPLIISEPRSTTTGAVKVHPKFPDPSGSSNVVSSSDSTKQETEIKVPKSSSEDSNVFKVPSAAGVFKSLRKKSNSPGTLKSCDRNISKPSSPMTSTLSSREILSEPGTSHNARTPEEFRNISGPLTGCDDTVSSSTSGGNHAGRPRDMNVGERKFRYVHSRGSPSDFVLKRWHSLPNVTPTKNDTSKKVEHDRNLIENVKRPLFGSGGSRKKNEEIDRWRNRSILSGNGVSDGLIPDDNSSTISCGRALQSQVTRPSEDRSNAKDSQASTSRSSKACKKLIFSSPLKSTNSNQAPQEASGTKPEEKVEQSTKSENVLEGMSERKAKQYVSFPETPPHPSFEGSSAPKRKIENIEDRNRMDSSMDMSVASPVKRPKIKPPTPEEKGGVSETEKKCKLGDFDGLEAKEERIVKESKNILETPACPIPEENISQEIRIESNKIIGNPKVSSEVSPKSSTLETTRVKLQTSEEGIKKSLSEIEKRCKLESEVKVERSVKETKNLLEGSFSPKRKIQDIESDRSVNALLDDRPSESVSKKTKLKPPSPEEEIKDSPEKSKSEKN